MVNKAIVEKLIDRAPIAVIVIGVLLIIIGAAGGLPIGDPPLQVEDFGWRITLSVIGGILMTVGLLLVWRGVSKKPTEEENPEGLKDPWSCNRTLRTGLEGAEDLSYAVKVLGDIHLWLSNDNSSIGTIQKNLWQVITDLEQEQSLYFVAYSSDMHKQLWALRRLSQIEPDKAKELMCWIIENPVISEQVKYTARQHLNEIIRRTNSKDDLPK